MQSCTGLGARRCCGVSLGRLDLQGILGSVDHRRPWSGGRDPSRSLKVEESAEDAEDELIISCLEEALLLGAALLRVPKLLLRCALWS